MNIALAGTACGQILTLFEFTFGYPESQESKERGKQLEELEHHFDADDLQMPIEETKDGDALYILLCPNGSHDDTYLLQTLEDLHQMPFMSEKRLLSHHHLSSPQDHS